MNSFFLGPEQLISFNPRLFIFHKHMVWALHGESSVVKWVFETWKLALSESISQFENSSSWQPDSYPGKTFLSPNSFVGDNLSSGSFCSFMASSLCSYILAFQSKVCFILFFLINGYASLVSCERGGWGGVDVAHVSVFPILSLSHLEKLSRNALCYLGIKCRLMPSCECCIL